MLEELDLVTIKSTLSKYDWKLIESTKTHILFKKKRVQYDFVEIKDYGDKIGVSVPLNNTVFQYNSFFKYNAGISTNDVVKREYYNSIYTYLTHHLVESGHMGIQQSL